MRTSNPTLSESAFKRLGGDQATLERPYPPPPPAPQADRGGVTQGPFGPASGTTPHTQADTFTIEGAIYKTGLLLAILIISGLAAAVLVPVSAYQPALIGSIVVSLVLVIAISFKPNLAPVLAPVYAIVEGVLLGIITLLIESQPGLDGIATQAALGTVTVLAVMLVLYKTGVIKVTQRFRMVIMAATGAIFLTYLASFVLGFFGVEFGFLHGNSMLSIGISLLIIGVAAMNLALDFNFIENAARAGLPAKTEWYAAFGLLVTLVWLYLEILRLLAKLQSRD